MSRARVSPLSEGREPDALELKASGSFTTELDLKRGQRVEVVLVGTVTGHDFRDTYDRNGDLDRTTKRAIVAGEQLLEARVVRVGRRAPKGQTAIAEDGKVIDARTGEVIADPLAEMRAEGVQVSVSTLGTQEPDSGSEEPAPAEEEPDAGAQDDADAIARDPMIPERAWNELNLDQKGEVAAIIVRIYRLGESFAGAGNPTDREAARSRAAALRESLLEEFGIELDMDAADAPPSEPDEPAPPVVIAGGPERTALELKRRRRYLERQAGLPADAAAGRREELAEIDRRLAELAPSTNA